MKSRQQHIDELVKKVREVEISAELCTEIKRDIQAAVKEYPRTANLSEYILNAQNKLGYTLLMWASYRHHLEIVQELLENKADIDLKDKDGQTALFFATRSEGSKCSSVVEALLAAGANPNIPSRNGILPLHIAVQHGDIEILKKLITDSEAITVKTKDYRTPLMFAVQRSSREFVQRVIELIPKDKLESELHEKNAKGQTVFDLADEPSIIALLLSYVINIPNPRKLLIKLRYQDQSNVVASLKLLLNKAPSQAFETLEDKGVHELYQQKLNELIACYDEDILERLKQIKELPLEPNLLKIVVQYDVPPEHYSRLFYHKEPENLSDMSGIDESINAFSHKRPKL